MNLPKKDTFGNNVLSYSQMATFKRDRVEYFNRYILKKPFISNKYIKFGSKVGGALEKNDFELFTKNERAVLSKITRLDQFERRIILRFDDFYVIGFMDTNSLDLTRIIDYKTGGKNKEKQYEGIEYNQLQVYALAIHQETGINVQDASVEFIRRKGNAFRGEPLMVDNEEPIVIKQDVSTARLDDVKEDIIRTANDISDFYGDNKEDSGMLKLF